MGEYQEDWKQWFLQGIGLLMTAEPDFEGRHEGVLAGVRVRRESKNLLCDDPGAERKWRDFSEGVTGNLGFDQ